jgi:hypothetical protein
MKMAYSVEIISMEQKEELVERYQVQVLYEIKSEIYGCCIKLLTGSLSVKNAWEESFYFASQNIRSHGRLYVLQDRTVGDNRVLYDPHSKSCFLFNIDYYGWIKSLALSLAGDILEDNHGIYSVHGACLDMRGRGVCILGGSGAGKTTHTYGLLRQPRARVSQMTGSSPESSEMIFWPTDQRRTSTSGQTSQTSGRSFPGWWTERPSTRRAGRWWTCAGP